jgi:hypothetical protein
MTKIFFLSTVFTVLTLTSCKKTHSCGCISRQVPQLDASGNYRDTKKNAAKKCEELETSLRQKVAEDVECELV